MYYADAALTHSSRQLSPSAASLIIGVYNTLPSPPATNNSTTNNDYTTSNNNSNDDFAVAYRQIIDADGEGHNYDLSPLTPSSTTPVGPKWFSIPTTNNKIDSAINLESILAYNDSTYNTATTTTSSTTTTKKKAKANFFRTFLLMLHPTTPTLLRVYERTGEAYTFLNTTHHTYINVCTKSVSDSIGAYGFRWRTCAGSYEECKFIRMYICDVCCCVSHT